MSIYKLPPVILQSPLVISLRIFEKLQDGFQILGINHEVLDQFFVDLLKHQKLINEFKQVFIYSYVRKNVKMPFYYHSQMNAQQRTDLIRFHEHLYRLMFTHDDKLLIKTPLKVYGYVERSILLIKISTTTFSEDLITRIQNGPLPQLEPYEYSIVEKLKEKEFLKENVYYQIAMTQKLKFNEMESHIANIGQYKYVLYADSFKICLLTTGNSLLLDEEFLSQCSPYLCLINASTCDDDDNFACIAWSLNEAFDNKKCLLVEGACWQVKILDVSQLFLRRKVSFNRTSESTTIQLQFYELSRQEDHFTKYIILCDTPTRPQVLQPHYILATRNEYVWHAQCERILRVQKVIYNLNVDFTQCWGWRNDSMKISFFNENQDGELTSNFDDDEDCDFDDSSSVASSLASANSSLKHKTHRTKTIYNTINRIQMPCIYFVYDVETCTHPITLRHYVFCICVESFIVKPGNSEFTFQDLEKISIIENPLGHIDFVNVEEQCVTRFLKHIVDVCLKHFSNHAEWFQGEHDFSSSMHERCKCNVRILGFNSARYDDKFIIPYIGDIFLPHLRSMHARGMTINKHQISNCECFGIYKSDVIVSFQDVMRFIPEIGSLKDTCEHLEIELPKIDFDIVKYSNEAYMGMPQMIDVFDLLIRYFKVDVSKLQATYYKDLKLNAFQYKQLKNQFMKIFGDDTQAIERFGGFPAQDALETHKFDINDIVVYYCERDVTATRIIIIKLMSGFRSVLKDMYEHEVEFLNPNMRKEKITYYDHLKNPYKYEHIVEQSEDADMPPTILKKRKQIKIPIENSAIIDVMEYMSIAQISHTFTKILMTANSLSKLNHKQHELQKFIKTAYFGGLVHFTFIGFYPNHNWEMIDVKSEYPLVMTGPLPMLNKQYTYRFIVEDVDIQFLQSKINSAMEARRDYFQDKSLHLFKPHRHINFLAILLCECIPPPVTQASLVCPLPYPELQSTGVRAIRYFTVTQTRVLTSHHICALIFQGWTVVIKTCNWNICFNIKKNNDRRNYSHKRAKTEKNYDNLNLKDLLVTNDQDDFCYLKQFVAMWGGAKADAAEQSDKVNKKLYKMVLNAAAGRLGMKDLSSYTTVDYELNEQNADIYHENYRSKQYMVGKSMYELAVFINSGALYVITRMQYLCQLKDIYPNNKPVWERHSSIAYTDTDSVLYSKQHMLPEVFESLIISKEIGTWNDDEFKTTWSIKTSAEECDAALILGKKAYMLLKYNEEKKGYTDVALHSKGIPLTITRKFFFDEKDCLRKDRLEEFLQFTKTTTFEYEGILRKSIEGDLSRKEFYSTILTKALSVCQLGSASLDGKVNLFQFLPAIPNENEPLCVFTHHPCEYADCEYCKEWHFRAEQSLDSYTWLFDRIL